MRSRVALVRLQQPPTTTRDNGSSCLFIFPYYFIYSKSVLNSETRDKFFLQSIVVVVVFGHRGHLRSEPVALHRVCSRQSVPQSSLHFQLCLFSLSPLVQPLGGHLDAAVISVVDGSLHSPSRQTRCLGLLFLHELARRIFLYGTNKLINVFNYRRGGGGGDGGGSCVRLE